MASWFSLPQFNAGDAVSASLIDAILDNITVLSTHNHSGSAGDGAGTLSSDANVGNTGDIYPYNTRILFPAWMPPASQSGWSTVTTCLIFSQNIIRGLDTTAICTDVETASGASIAYVFKYTSPSTFFPSFYVDYWTGPSGGNISCCINGASVASFTTYNVGNSDNVSAPTAAVSVASGAGSIVLKMQVTGSGTGGGYRARLTNIVMILP